MNPYAVLTDFELIAMTTRAYAGAASAWRALNKPLPGGPYGPDDYRATRMFQLADAQALDDHWNALRAEQQRRKDATP